MVETAQYSDLRAADWVTECLIQRRDKIGRAFLDEVLPLDEFAVNGGKLVFEDLAVRYRIRQPKEYSVQLVRVRQLERTEDADYRELQASACPTSAAAYVAAEIRSDDPRKTVTVYLRGARSWASIAHGEGMAGGGSC